MAREIARVTTSQNAPLAAASVLGILSASLGAGLEISTGGERRTRGNLFMLAIAESGTGKGEAFNLAAAPFEVAEAEVIEAFDMHTMPALLAELAVAEISAKDLSKKAAKDCDPSVRRRTMEEFKRASEAVAEIKKQIDAAPRWKVSDTTKEALTRVMSGQPGEAVASLSSEARGVIAILMGRYGKVGGDEDFYCSGYSGDQVSSDRVSRGKVILRSPCLSILWMIQPDAARTAFGEESLTDSGLLPRFLLFDPMAEPKERTAHPVPIPSGIKGGWASLVRSLAETYRMQGNEPKNVVVSEEAYGIFLDYENENIRFRQGGGEHRDITSYVARWTENAWRLALVIHAALHGATAHEVVLDSATANNALEIMRWFTGRQLEVLNSGRNEKLRKRLLALLAVLADAHGEISIRDLRRSHSIDRAEVVQLQTVLPGYFRIVKRQGATGRPSEVVSNLPADMK
jgi:hypothetical protein